MFWHAHVSIVAWTAPSSYQTDISAAICGEIKFSRKKPELEVMHSGKYLSVVESGKVVVCLKKALNASRPSEHPSIMGEMSKRLGGIIGCKYKISSCHLNGLPDGSKNGSTLYYRGETHGYVVHLH